MPPSILFSSDLHGNRSQYENLAKIALEKKIEILILGGDLSPHDIPPDTMIDEQLKFFSEYFIPWAHRLNKALRTIKIYYLLGNDDCMTSLELLRKQETDFLQNIHGKRIALGCGLDIVGYSYVPMTPFMIKDWEKFDWTEVPPKDEIEYGRRKMVNYSLIGMKSTLSGWKSYKFPPRIEESESIEKDLENAIYKRNPERTIYVIHTPPNNTPLDMTAAGMHVGSMALRSFIELNQPYLTLHGHIHETVKISGQFKQRIGKTWCMASGNAPYEDSPYALLIDCDNLSEAERIQG